MPRTLTEGTMKGFISSLSPSKSTSDVSPLICSTALQVAPRICYQLAKVDLGRPTESQAFVTRCHDHLAQNPLLFPLRLDKRALLLAPCPGLAHRARFQVVGIPGMQMLVMTEWNGG